MLSLIKILKIYAINNTSFVRLARKKNHILFIVIFRNIEKALIIKSLINSITILLFEYHDFLNVFSRKTLNTLFKHRFYDHKIQLELNKISGFKSLYDMF